MEVARYASLIFNGKMTGSYRSEHQSESSDGSASAVSESEDHSPNRIQTIVSHLTREDASDTFSPASAPASFHTQGLLHSLLEERSMQQALKEVQERGVPDATIDDPEVQKLGHSIYLRVSRSLGGLGVTKQGFDSPQYSPIRKNYLEALDLLSHQTSTPTRPQMQKAVSQIDMAIPANFRKHIAAAESMEVINRELHLMSVAEERTSIGMPVHQVYDGSKYSRDFKELRILGKGGYGVVFHVENRLDGCTYAIKKIPIGAKRMRRMNENGQAEMEEILRELRTLAKLNHPNVVRYYTGWIESASFPTMQSALRSNGRKLLEAPGRPVYPDDDVDTPFTFDDDLSQSVQDTTISQSNDSSDHGILFEDIDGDDRAHADSFSDRTASLQDNDNSLEKMPSRNTLVGFSDGEVESIRRSADGPSASGISSDGEGLTLKPGPALYIQMTMYSMSLSDFLSSKDSDDINTSIPASLRHCFHPSASLTILLSIIEGIRYLHREGIVHRDLKPGNVFLCVRPGNDGPPGAVDLSACETCTETSQRRYFNTDVCIGDFGLVCTIAEDKTTDPPPRVVGTKTYRPDAIKNANHPRLDVFALGLITFELFWKFETQSERHFTLAKLRSGIFPQDFDKKVGCTGLQKLIASMVSATEMDCPSWDVLKAAAINLKG